MKQRHILAVLMLLVCLSIFGQQSKSVPMQGQPQKTSSQVSTNQQELILQLQAENEAMQKQLEKMEKEIELYRGDVRTKISELDEEQSRWTAWICLFVTLLAGGLGVAVPIFINNRNDKRLKESYEKMVEELKTQIDSVEKDAKSAKESLSTITGLKEDIDKIKNDIDKSKKAAERAAKRAIANKLFTQALAEKNLLKSIELYTKAIDLNPDFAEAYNNRGYAKSLINDKEGALEDYNISIKLDPKIAETYNNRGNVKDDLDDKDGAMIDYDEAIKLNPIYANAYNNRGTLKKDFRDLDGAMSDYNKAIELLSNFPEAYCNRGILKKDKGDIRGALEDYQEALKYNPLFYGAYLCRGHLERSIGNYKNAINDYSQTLVLYANNTDALDGRALCYRKLAEAEQDSAKKADLIAKAEADEKKVESLKKGDKV